MSQSQLPQVHVDAAAFAPAERFERWKTSIGNTFSVGLPERLGVNDFTYQIRYWQLGGLLMNDVQFGARSQRRAARNIRSDQLDHYRVVLQTEGVLRSDAGGQARTVGPGELLLTDMAQEEIFESDGGANIVVFMPRDTLDSLLPRAYDLHGVKPQGAVARLLADHLRALASSAAQIDAGSAPALAGAILQLVAASLGPSMQALGLARPALESGALRQMQRFVDLHLSQSDLSADTLCRQFKISRSTLYRLFEPLGGVAQYVKERRLARIHALLSTSTGRIHLGRLADDHGFKGAPHFSRAFREQYGYSPSDVQRFGAAALRNEPARISGPTAAFESWVRSLRE